MFLGIFLVLVAAFVLYRGVRDVLHIRNLRAQGRETIGTVTGHESRPHSRTLSVIVTWTDDYGVTHQLTSSLSGGRASIAIGENVTVRYLPGDPASATIDDRREHIRTAILVLVIGLGFGAAGVTFVVRGD